MRRHMHKPVPSAALAEWVKGRIHSEGTLAVAQELGCDPNSLLRAAIGVPLRRGTIVLLEQAMRDYGEDPLAPEGS